MMAPRSTAYSGALYPPTPTAPSPSNGPNPTMFYPMMHPNVPLMHSSTAPIHYPFVNNSFINQKLASQHPNTVLEKPTLDSPNIEVSTSYYSALVLNSLKIFFSLCLKMYERKKKVKKNHFQPLLLFCLTVSLESVCIPISAIT